MHIVLFTFYLFLCCYLLTKLRCVRRSSLKQGLVLGFFMLHAAIGCLHNWIAWRYFHNHGDIWLFFHNSFVTRQQLRTGFAVFWTDNSRLADLPHNLIEWLHVILNTCSWDNIYINTLLFSFLTLGGYLVLFETIYRRLNKDILCALSAILLPSVLFWTSCIDTEGLVYPLLGWLVYYIDRLLAERWNTRRVLCAGLVGGLAIFLRPALAVGLVPALAAWLLIDRFPTPRRQFAIAMTGIIFVGVLYLVYPPIFSRIFSALSTRQRAFQSLTGGSRIALPLLEPNGSSFIRVLPRALLNGLFEPMPGSGGQAIYGLFSAELLFIWILVIIGALARFIGPPPPSPLTTHHSPFTTFCLLLAILSLLLIGYIVPFVGAIIRYRSIYLPFLLFPFLIQLQHYRIPTRLNKWLTRRIIKP